MTDWTLITFDVDGTLLQGFGDKPNAAHRNAFADAGVRRWGDKAREVFERVWAGRPSQGATDGMMVLFFAKEMGVSEEEMIPQMPAFFDAIVECYAQSGTDVLEGVRSIPGVKTTLDKLAAKERIAFGLVTGNLETIAWTKMKALGLPFGKSLGLKGGIGGFGSDVMPTGVDVIARGRDRGHQILKALEKAEALLPEGHSITRRFHVGDTSADIDAAEFANAVPIGVTTGKFSEEDLRPALKGKGVILDSIDSDAFWNAI
eukprot:GEMP01046432.1.p1 GENE.GEMP01046432.1~~GEMP01046432.1.p1  ORF type:complete len:260 (+),score=70.44 GEMP01046432.1:25-804(+)